MASIRTSADWRHTIPSRVQVRNAVGVGPDFGSSSQITNRLGWVIALLVIIILILLSAADWDSEPDMRRHFRQLAGGFPIVKTGLTVEELPEARNTPLVSDQGAPGGIYDAFG